MSTQSRELEAEQERVERFLAWQRARGRGLRARRSRWRWPAGVVVAGVLVALVVSRLDDPADLARGRTPVAPRAERVATPLVAPAPAPPAAVEPTLPTTPTTTEPPPAVEPPILAAKVELPSRELPPPEVQSSVKPDPALPPREVQSRVKPEAPPPRELQARVKPEAALPPREVQARVKPEAALSSPELQARAKPGTALPPRGRRELPDYVVDSTEPVAELGGGLAGPLAAAAEPQAAVRERSVTEAGRGPERPASELWSSDTASEVLAKPKPAPPPAAQAPQVAPPVRSPVSSVRPSVPPPAATAAKAPAPPGPPPAAPRPVERVQPPVAVPEVAEKPLPFGLETVKRLIQSAPEVRLGRKIVQWVQQQEPPDGKAAPEPPRPQAR